MEIDEAQIWLSAIDRKGKRKKNKNKDRERERERAGRKAHKKVRLTFGSVRSGIEAIY